jgi:hypothetical protein
VSIISLLDKPQAIVKYKQLNGLVVSSEASGTESGDERGREKRAKNGK